MSAPDIELIRRLWYESAMRVNCNARQVRVTSVRLCSCVLTALLCCCSHSGTADDAGMHARDANSASDAASGDNCNAKGATRRTFYVDKDGDGFGVPGAGFKIGCGDVAPAGFSPNALDCDDHDVSKQRLRYVD